MARIQDIRAFEEEIFTAVQEFIDNQEGYTTPFLHVYLDKDIMKYCAELVDESGAEDEGYYPAAPLVPEEDGILVPDYDQISPIANSWIFID